MLQTEKEKISGMTREEYRAWMKDTCRGVLIKNDSSSVDSIIESMKGVPLQLKVMDESEFEVIP